MGSNIAARRAAKALRRKAVVAQKRKLELVAASLPERVRRAATAPIHQCLLSTALFSGGLGTLVMARGSSAAGYAVGVFLVDAGCLGVKDAYFRSIDGDEYEFLVSRIRAVEPIEPVDPSLARKLLRDLTRWSDSIGFAPPPHFQVIESIFGDTSADACDATFTFGRQGKPFYVSGAFETPAQVQRRIDVLRGRLGGDGFDEDVNM